MINPLRAAHIAAFFLAHAPRKTLSNLKLMKLMYLAERECMRKLHRKMTGSRLCIMNDGQVLSDVYRYMTRQKPEPKFSNVWRDWIQRTGENNNNQKLNRTLDCDLSDLRVTNHVLNRLSRNDMKILAEIQKKHGAKTARELVDFCHNLGEYKGNIARLEAKKKSLRKKNTSVFIEDDDVFIHFRGVDAAQAKFLGECCREDASIRGVTKLDVTYDLAA